MFIVKISEKEKISNQIEDNFSNNKSTYMHTHHILTAYKGMNLVIWKDNVHHINSWRCLHNFILFMSKDPDNCVMNGSFSFLGGTAETQSTHTS